jgi:hypothetical protein
MIAALTIGLAAAILGISAHAIILRFLSTRLAFPSVPLLCFVALAASAWAYNGFMGAVSLAAVALAFALCMSFELCYALILVGVVHDSPTLALANAILDRGAQGLPLSDLPGFIQRHPFVSSRVSALLQSGPLTVQGDHFASTQTTSFFLELGERFRRLRGSGPPAE